MDQNKVIAIAAVVVLMFVAGPVVWVQISPSKITLDQYNRIEPGMSYEEVVKIIGREGLLRERIVTENKLIEIESLSGKENMKDGFICPIRQRIETRPSRIIERYGWFTNMWSEADVMTVTFGDGVVGSKQNIGLH